MYRLSLILPEVIEFLCMYFVHLGKNCPVEWGQMRGEYCKNSVPVLDNVKNLT